MSQANGAAATEEALLTDLRQAQSVSTSSQLAATGQWHPVRLFVCPTADSEALGILWRSVLGSELAGLVDLQWQVACAPTEGCMASRRWIL